MPPAPACDSSNVRRPLAALWQGDGGHFVAHIHRIPQLDQGQIIVPVRSVLEAWMKNNLQEGDVCLESVFITYNIKTLLSP